MTMNQAVPAPRRVLGIRIRRYADALFLALRDRTVRLDGPALLIFESIDGDRSVHQIAVRVAQEYGVDVPTAVADTQELVDDLVLSGFVKR